MAIIQISKILTRRGPEADLPISLDVGEFGFTTDSGRVFIGHEPIVGQANFARAQFPFQNVEVLTENSTETLTRLLGTALQSMGKAAFATASLDLSSPNTWTTLVVAGAPFQFSGPNLSATIDYSIFTTSNTPVRSGRIRVSHPGDNTEPSLTDEAISHAQLSLGSTDPAAIYGLLRFRFTLTTISGADYYQMMYQNNTGQALKMFLRNSRIVP